MMDRKESPSIVIITEKGNNERHFPPAFFPFFFSNFDNSRVIVRPSAGGAAAAATSGVAHGYTAVKQYSGDMAVKWRASARGSMAHTLACRAASRGDCGGGLL